MKVKPNTLGELISPLRQVFQKSSFSREDVDENSPLRSELFNIEQLENHARQLAQSHHLSYEPASEQLLKRLDDNREILSKANVLLQNAVREKTPVMPAGEWLMDNYYLIEEQINTGKRHLPKGYSKGLPKLRDGSSADFPRVYDLAIEIISHSDGHVDMLRLTSFIKAYQEVHYLTLGELWAIPIMLRLALIENLRRVAARIGIDRIDADLAHYWADRIITTSEQDPKNLVLVIADMARSNPPMVSAFVAEFSRKLQWRGPNLNFALTWIEQHLTESGFSIASMVLLENQKQAADQVSMSNSINSLRFLAKMDWREFVQSMSVVEQILGEDHDSVYPNMDFYTRDYYRHQVEMIAKQSRKPEHEVARLAIRMAAENIVSDPTDNRKGHVGYFLVGEGRPVIENLVHLKLSFWKKIQKAANNSKYGIYVTSSSLLTLIGTGGLFYKAWLDGTAPSLLVLIAVLALLGASHFAFAIVNWIATLRVMPSPLPRMNYATGIPVTSRTMVVVPTLIANQKQADKLVDDLEVRFLSNRDEHLHFALLTDFRDAPTKTVEGDDELLSRVKDKIEQLNIKYGRTSNDTFFLFHRPRQYNPVEKTWMGYERKRGKLEELNHLMRGSSPERFSVIVGDAKIYTDIHYVITLDTDTQLPRESAWKLVGMMSHPMNRPVYDPVSKTVIKGYGIIQPRIAISLHGATRSLYTRMNESDAGIDPYTRVTSDVYQDIFNEGSFIGKGIYDVDAFETVLHKRFPENRILSHDLLEGSYVRCGFASDVQFYEEYPSRYQEDMARRHRWIRGDWQIGNWFLPFVPDSNGKQLRNSISALSRWKILDNLRRSLVPIALVLLQFLGWTLLSSPGFWTITVIGIIMLPSAFISLWNLFHKPDEGDMQHHLKNSLQATNRTMVQAMFTLICLPYEAYVSADAILRTLWRLIISRRRLLEWNPSGFVQMEKSTSLIRVYTTMWIIPVIFILSVAYLIFMKPDSLHIASPFLVLWVLSPVIVWWFSLPQPSRKSELSADQRLFLRTVARRTWLFFENIITGADNWLPPDNLQQYPIPVIAHRTSPTNMAISLLSNLTAYDFGYATMDEFLERTSRTMETMTRMERYLGHFYNWYDTQSLAILAPRYISTVDSGNLAGHMLTLRQGILSLPRQRIIDQKLWNGLSDTARLLAEESMALRMSGGSALLEKFLLAGSESPATPRQIKSTLEQLQSELTAWTAKQSDQGAVANFPWTKALSTQIKSAVDELNYFCPVFLLPEAPEKWKTLAIINSVPTLEILSDLKGEYADELQVAGEGSNSQEDRNWMDALTKCCQEMSIKAKERIDLINKLSVISADFANVEYDFLYDKQLHLLAIGYNVDAHHRDGGYYDLLASEARLGLFVAIGQGKLPQESWFALGRRLATADNTPVLLSWTGTMFEYLMPMLVMPNYENTLLDQTCVGVVKRQIEYGREQDVPWGISESCYNTVDSSLNYQYRAFGVPGLGFKRGLSQDLVIAPYASAMALMVDPADACKNLEFMRDKGFMSHYGFFEAIDYTPSRLPRGQNHVLIQTFMVHHQSMSLLSLSYLLLDQPMQKRFSSDPQCQTAMLLLQEQVPKATRFYAGSAEDEKIAAVSSGNEMRVITTADTPVPEVQLLSNGHYHVMVTNSGSGYSRWKNIAVTRWREDATLDNRGTFVYLKNSDTGELWSASHQPTLKKPSLYEVIFSQGRVEFRRIDNEIETYTEIIISPEDDIEIRRTHITNHSRTKRNLEITSYGEVVIDLPSVDSSHPAFSNLFVQTEIIAHQQAILCTRRPRAHDEKPPFMFHLMKVNGPDPGTVSYETDRSKFIGRGKSVANPAALLSAEPLSGSQGSVLDPVVAIQTRFVLGAEQTITIDVITGIAATREGTQSLIDKYQDKHMRNRAFELSWTHSQVVLRQINATEADAQLYGRLAGAVIYSNPALRAPSDILMKNQKGQSGLWSYSISGDLPIVLLQISDTTNVTLVKQLMQARTYWQLKGLVTDLVIINEDHGSYRQLLQDEIQGIVTAGVNVNVAGNQGGIFVRSADQIPAEDYILLQTVARVIISDTRGTLKDQITKPFLQKANIPLLPAGQFHTFRDTVAAPADLEFFNGFGGFTKEGNEYAIITDNKHTTPLPWINVIANKNFGTIVSDSGSSYTWSENAHEFRLTPWENDPVSDNCGEVFYIRDEETGQFWSPMPLPRMGKSPYVTRHGFGYSVIEHSEDGIASEVTIFVDANASVKFTSIKLKNNSGRPRKLTATGYAEWVLGSERPKSAMYIVTELEGATGALVARNSYSTEFASHVAFFDSDDGLFNYTCDRSEFIGRNGSLQNPDAIKRQRLSGRSGAGMDPCAVIQIPIELNNGLEREIIFRLGSGKDIFEARDTIRKFRGKGAAKNALANVKQFWKETLSAVQIDTPDRALTLLTNGWLMYQVMGCRLWGRSGFYQSGGAYGFRDQLQDVLSLLHTAPHMTRAQILLSASRQFREGDVQHWWHPPLGRGVRTLCSDDFLWLPYATSRYIAGTGDLAVTDEPVSWLEGRLLNVDEESYYDLPIVSGSDSLYEHCKQAIRHGLRFGEHGLPLMGSGDWNDGMNLVGIKGKGESVWLAFFLYDVLKRFEHVAALKNDDGFSKECEKQAVTLKANIHKHAWDGQWYLRAYFDDGALLGSSQNTECRIDSISQSWSVISEGGESDRSLSGMQSVDHKLVDREHGLIRLLDPPFDKITSDPGYIKGYVPGVRENGGQYTHAAVWMIMAFAKMGNRERTSELLNLINPINHGKTKEDVLKYKAEPYVIAADVYGTAPHEGRGGWTWYTGSAGWTYQLVLDWVLGLTRDGSKLSIKPCVPEAWPSFRVTYRYEKTEYVIDVEQLSGSEAPQITIDGIEQPGGVIQLKPNDGRHEVRVKRLNN